MSLLLRLPPEVFTAVATYLPINELARLSEVCRIYDGIVQTWMSRNTHPLHNLFTCSGYYWFRTDGVFYTKTFENIHRLDVGVRLRGTSSFAACLADDTDDVEALALPGAAANNLMGRTHCLTAVVGRTIYRFGGRTMTHENRLKSCFCVDPLARTISPLPPLTGKRSAAAGAAVGSRVFIMGGYDGASELNTMEVFDTTKKEWMMWDGSVWTNPGDTHARPDDDGATAAAVASVTRTQVMPFSICEHSATAVGDRFVMILGGCERRGRPDERSVASVWLLDTRGNKWMRLSDMPSDRILGCAVYREFLSADDAVRHVVLFYGGESLNPDEESEQSATFVLNWQTTSRHRSGEERDKEFLTAVSNAQWEVSSIAGGRTVMNSIALLTNTSTMTTSPPEAQFCVVDEHLGLKICDHSWTVVSQNLVGNNGHISAVCRIS